MLPYDCKDGMDCPHYHECNEGNEDRECPLTEMLDYTETRTNAIDELIGDY